MGRICSTHEAKVTAMGHHKDGITIGGRKIMNMGF
jgi:hypothetical protein